MDGEDETIEDICALMYFPWHQAKEPDPDEDNYGYDSPVMMMEEWEGFDGAGYLEVRTVHGDTGNHIYMGNWILIPCGHRPRWSVK